MRQRKMGEITGLMIGGILCAALVMMAFMAAVWAVLAFRGWLF